MSELVEKDSGWYMKVISNMQDGGCSEFLVHLGVELDYLHREQGVLLRSAK